MFLIGMDHGFVPLKMLLTKHSRRTCGCVRLLSTNLPTSKLHGLSESMDHPVWAARGKQQGLFPKRRLLPMQAWLAQAASRDEAVYRAHTEGGLSMTRPASALTLSVSRVSRVITEGEAKGKA